MDAKIATVAQLNRHVGIDAGYASATDDIGQVQPLVQACNQAVAPFISTQLTQQTKDTILTEMRYLLERLGTLDTGLENALRNDNMVGDSVRYCVAALAVFSIMISRKAVGN